MSDSPFSSINALKLFILESINDMVDLHKALDHPTRLEILARLLIDYKEFKDLLNEMNIPKTTLANHLSILIDFGLVEKLDRGLYRISFDGEELLEASATVYLNSKIREQQRLERLKEHFKNLIRKYTEQTGDEMINTNQLKILTLQPQKVVSFHSMGEFIGDPETKAFQKLSAWANSRKIFDVPGKHQLFGFNNPNPTRESKIYGYEFWLTVPQDYDTGTVKTKHLAGGEYAVLRCLLSKIGPAWKDLMELIKASNEYEADYSRQCLEHSIDPKVTEFEKVIMDLYQPIKKKNPK